MRVSNVCCGLVKFVILGFMFTHLNGCTLGNQVWEPGADEGMAVRNAIRAQSKYPDGRPDVGPVTGMDGVSAKASIDNYQRSFAAPRQPASTSSSGAPTGSNTPSTPATPAAGPTGL